MNTPRLKQWFPHPRKVYDWGLLLLLLGILVAAGLLSTIAGMQFAIRRTEVAVPELVAKTVEEAEAMLKDKELGLEVIGKRYDDNIAEGRIIQQSPAPGGRLKIKRDVQALISLGKRYHPVPKLVGTTLRVAELTAAEYNYEIGQVSEIAYGKRGGIVLDQDPHPGAIEAVSPSIDVLVSRSRPDDYIMPDLTGKNLNEVKPFLEQRGFRLARVQYQFYRNAEKGTVVKQFPEAGFRLTSEDPINLEVAR